MNKSDRIYFSNFDVDPDFEALYEYDDLYEWDFEASPDHFEVNSDSDDPDDLAWDLD
jgi:hypothetical protein